MALLPRAAQRAKISRPVVCNAARSWSPGDQARRLTRRIEDPVLVGQNELSLGNWTFRDGAGLPLLIEDLDLALIDAHGYFAGQRRTEVYKVHLHERSGRRQCGSWRKRPQLQPAAARIFCQHLPLS